MLLDNWLEALALLANLSLKVQRPLRVKRVVLLVVCVLCCAACIAVAIYATVCIHRHVSASATDATEFQFLVRQQVAIAFRVFSAIALALVLLTLAACCIGLAWVGKAHTVGVVRGIVFFGIVAVGAVLHCVWAFAATGSPLQSVSIIFWLYYIVGEALILAGLLAYAFAGVVAFRARNMLPQHSAAHEPLLQQQPDDYVPLIYRE